MPRPMAELRLSDDEKQTLKTWASRPKSTQRLATRARIVLTCAEGLDNKAVAARLGRVAWAVDRDPACVGRARVWVARERGERTR